jgi:phage regulator Rha-like protein
MARDRHKKAHTNPTLYPPHYREKALSPAVLSLQNRIIEGGVDYLEKNFIRVLTESAKLAREPEFSDLSFDGEKAMQVTERWLKRFEKRLNAAEKKGQDEYQQVYDDMRIKVIDELATPAFRKTIDERLAALINRLAATNDLKYLEIALLLKPILQMKKIPLGVNGLILEIYNSTMDQAMQKYEEDNEVFDILAEAFDEAGIDTEEILESPEKIEEFGAKLLSKNPDLRRKIEAKMEGITEAFEDELFKGNIELDLFTEEELLLPFQRYQKEFEELNSAELDKEKEASRIIKLIQETIDAIMTPERYKRLRQHIESTIKIWMKRRYKWAYALQFEMGYLEEEKYAPGLFITTVFWGQLCRKGKLLSFTFESGKRKN